MAKNDLPDMAQSANTVRLTSQISRNIFVARSFDCYCFYIYQPFYYKG